MTISRQPGWVGRPSVRCTSLASAPVSAPAVAPVPAVATAAGVPAGHRLVRGEPAGAAAGAHRDVVARAVALRSHPDVVVRAGIAEGLVHHLPSVGVHTVRVVVAAPAGASARSHQNHHGHRRQRRQHQPRPPPLYRHVPSSEAPSVSLISYLPRILEVPTRKPTIGTLVYGRVSRSKAGSEDF